MNRLTVIIPTWNQMDLLQGCLRSLHKQEDSCHVLIVDNGSTDPTEEMVKLHMPHFPFGLEYLKLEDNRGFAAAANVGIQAASTEFIALLNNDTEVDPDWVKVGVGALEEHLDYSIFASKIVDYYRRDQLDSAGDCYNRRGIPYKRGRGESVKRFSKTEPVLGASAAAAFYRKKLFNEIGLFDEDFFMYLEDVDLSLRAQLAGHRCLYLPDAIVYHMEAASDPMRNKLEQGNDTAIERDHSNLGKTVLRSGRYSADRAYWITRNRWQIMVTYQPLRNIPWVLLGWIHSTFFHLFKAGQFVSFCWGLLAGLFSTRRALQKRLALNQGKTLSTRQLLALFKQCEKQKAVDMRRS